MTTYSLPTITGGRTIQVTDEANAFPWYGLSLQLSDPNAADPAITDTLTITLSGAGGSIGDSYPDLVQFRGSGNTYTLTGSLNNIENSFGFLYFTSNPGTYASPAITNFSVTLSSVLNGTVVATSLPDTSMSVTDSDPLTAPTIVDHDSNPQQVIWDRSSAPFAQVSFSDSNRGTTDQLVIQIAPQSGAGGTLTDGANFKGSKTLTGNGDTYYLTGSASAIQTEMQALQFNPATGDFGSVNTTDFNLTLNVLGSGGQVLISTTDNKTVVTDTDKPITPTISYLFTYSTNFNEPATPFSAALLDDSNAGTTDRLTISFSPGSGTLADGAGFSLQGITSSLTGGNGVYTLQGTAANITTELHYLAFTPTLGALGSSTTVTFALTDDATFSVNSQVISSLPATAKLTVSDAPVAPIFSDNGSKEVISYFQAPVTLFAGVTVNDPDPYATYEVVTITPSGGGGTLSDATGFTGSTLQDNKGVYTLTGTVAQVDAELDQLQFTPISHDAGTTTNTTITLEADSYDADGLLIKGTVDPIDTVTVVDIVPATAPGLAITGVQTVSTTAGATQPSTSSADVSIAGTNDPSQAGAAIAIYDGNHQIAKATASASGAWSVDATLPGTSLGQVLTAEIAAQQSATFTYSPTALYGSFADTGENIGSVIGVDATGDVVGEFSGNYGYNFNDFGFIEKGGVTTLLSSGAGVLVSTPIAVDQAGDVLFSEYGNNNNSTVSYFIYTAAGTYEALPTGWTPFGMDAAGNVYAQSTTGTTYAEFLAGSITPTSLPALNGATFYGLAVDPAGDIYGGGSVLFSGAASATKISVPNSQGTTIAGVGGHFVYGTFSTVAGVTEGFVYNAQSAAYTTFIPLGASSLNVVGVDAAGDAYGNFKYLGSMAYQYGVSAYGFVEQNGVIGAIAPPGAFSTTVSGVTSTGAVYGTFFDSPNSTVYGFIEQNGVYQTVDLQGFPTLTMNMGVGADGTVYGLDIATSVGNGISLGSFSETNGVYSAIDIGQLAMVWGADSSGDVFGVYGDSSGNSHGFVEQANGLITNIDVPASAAGQTVSGTIVSGVYDNYVFGFDEFANGDLGSFVKTGGIATGGTYQSVAVAGASDTWVIGGVNGYIYGTYVDNTGKDHGFLYNLNDLGSLGTLGALSALTPGFIAVDDPSAGTDVAPSTPLLQFLGGALHLTDGSGAVGIDANHNIYGTYVDQQGNVHGFVDVNNTFTNIDVPGAANTVITHLTDSGVLVGTYLTADGSAYGFVGHIDAADPTKDTFTTSSAPGIASPELTVSVGTSSGVVFAGSLGNYVAEVSTAPCYCRGTRIATARGEVAVEDLRIGDLARTQSGAARPVVWIGRREVDVARHPAPRDVQPVLIEAGAFGDLPRRDLWVSPGHNITAEGALMPACALINGISVRQVAVNHVEYFHVELDAHDIVLAEGLPAESYLDCGNRTDFANGGAFVTAHPDFKPKHWAQTCLPIVKDGPEVARTKARLIERLQAQGHTIVRQAGPYILADGGRNIEPVRLSETRLMFALPEGAEGLVLRSKVFVPAQTKAEATDTRELGLCIKRLQINGDDWPLDRNEALAAGWHEAEGENGQFTHRWTNGSGALPPGARLVLVDLADHGFYWRDRNDSVTRLFG